MDKLTQIFGAIREPFRKLSVFFNTSAEERRCLKLDQTQTLFLPLGEKQDSKSDFEAYALRAARAISRQSKTFAYPSEAECAKNHAQYEKQEYLDASHHAAAGMPISVLHKVTVYTPKIVGIQAAKDNPELAVPIYSGKEDNKGLRADGLNFNW